MILIVRNPLVIVILFKTTTIWLIHKIHLNDFEQPDQLKIYSDFQIINTCNIDYFLYALCLSAQFSTLLLNNFKSYLNDLNASVLKIIENIQNYNWNKAKTIYVLITYLM